MGAMSSGLCEGEPCVCFVGPLNVAVVSFWDRN